MEPEVLAEVPVTVSLVEADLAVGRELVDRELVALEAGGQAARLAAAETAKVPAAAKADPVPEAARVVAAMVAEAPAALQAAAAKAAEAIKAVLVRDRAALAAGKALVAEAVPHAAASQKSRPTRVR